MQADRQFRRGTRTMRLAVLQQEIGALETEQAVQEECRAAIRRFVEEEGQARAQVQVSRRQGGGGHRTHHAPMPPRAVRCFTA